MPENKYRVKIRGDLFVEEAQLISVMNTVRASGAHFMIESLDEPANGVKETPRVNSLHVKVLQMAGAQGGLATPEQRAVAAMAHIIDRREIDGHTLAGLIGLDPDRGMGRSVNVLERIIKGGKRKLALYVEREQREINETMANGMPKRRTFYIAGPRAEEFFANLKKDVATDLGLA